MSGNYIAVKTKMNEAGKEKTHVFKMSREDQYLSSCTELQTTTADLADESTCSEKVKYIKETNSDIWLPKPRDT